MKTADLRALVRQRYATGGWAVFDEVRNETGWTTGRPTRSADMLALSLWRSRGLELHGFELKVSRGDWLRELRQPDKAAAVMKYTDRWWLVAPPNVATVSELPVGWGMLVVEHSFDLLLPRASLVVSHPAPKRIAEPLDRLFVASLVRRVSRKDFTVAEDAPLEEQSNPQS